MGITALRHYGMKIEGRITIYEVSIVALQQIRHMHVYSPNPIILPLSPEGIAEATWLTWNIYNLQSIRVYYQITGEVLVTVWHKLFKPLVQISTVYCSLNDV